VTAGRVVLVDLADWCATRMGVAVGDVQFEAGNLSLVRAYALADGRTVVVKRRPWEIRLVAASAVHQAAHTAGFPCPPLLVPANHVDQWALSIEGVVPGGQQLDAAAPDAPMRYAQLLHDLLDATSGNAPTGLRPSPPWTAWDHEHAGTWPGLDDTGRDLNCHPGPAWVDEAADRVRDRLARLTDPLVIGHGDFESQNIRWRDDGRPLAVHDWDSVIAQPEACIVGLASAVWAAAFRVRSSLASLVAVSAAAVRTLSPRPGCAAAEH
jgi:hypothetical protein